MRHPHVSAALVAAAFAGCAAPPVHDPPARPQVALADSIPYGDGMTDGVLRRFVVTNGERRDTVPGVLVADLPIVGPGGAVYGIRMREELAVSPFAYDPSTRRIRVLPRPEGWSEPTRPRLSPDGRHVAYLAEGAGGRAHAAVATLPGARVVYLGPPAVLRETGAGVDDITWLSPHQFEIRVYMGGATGGIQRVRGSIAPLAVQVDTLHEPWELGQAPM